MKHVFSVVGALILIAPLMIWGMYKPARVLALHHRQVEELGILAHLAEPKWLIEGMAYSLSEDPRRPLSEPWQHYRAMFEAWRQKIGKENLWKEARRL